MQHVFWIGTPLFAYLSFPLRFDGALLVLLLAAVTIVCAYASYVTLRTKVLADDEGVTVTNGIKERRIPWAEVRGFALQQRKMPLRTVPFKVTVTGLRAVARTRDGEVVMAAISGPRRGTEGHTRWAQTAIDELCAYLELRARR